MKNIFSILTLMISCTAFSQVVISGATGTATDNTSVLLDFAPGQNKGLILPYVRTMPATPTEGTILLDASTATTARVKYYNGTWQDLSGQDANVTSALANQPTELQAPELATTKSIIGAQTSPAEGVLILESTTKAMVLPTVADVQNIPSPSPGMMVYINKAGAKRLAIFNGAKWSFWKP